MLHGIAQYSRLHGPWRVYRRSAGLESSFPEWRDLKIDGAIVRDVKMVQNLTGSGIPVIFAQHKKATTPPFPAIVTDSAAIGQVAAEHFLDRGFSHFAYCGYDEFVWSRLRARHFSERLKTAGFATSLYRQPKRVAERAWKSEQYLIADWLVSLPKPVALMCCNDDRALQVIEACKLAELYVPDQVAVLGVDNDVLICDLADPPISSVALNTEVAGHDAAKMLDHLMNGGRMMGQIVWVRPTHIVTRMSTDILAVTDSAVASALRFIRLNCASDDSGQRRRRGDECIEAGHRETFQSHSAAVRPSGNPPGPRRPYRRTSRRDQYENPGNRQQGRFRRRRAHLQVLPARDRRQPSRVPKAARLRIAPAGAGVEPAHPDHCGRRTAATPA